MHLKSFFRAAPWLLLLLLVRPGGSAAPASPSSLTGAAASLNATDFPSIQAAIDATPPQGGTVFIPAGTYTATSATTFVPPLVLPTGKPVTLEGAGTGRTILTATASSKDVNLIEVRGDGQTVRGLSLFGAGVAGSGRGIQIGRAAAATTGGPTDRILIEDVAMSGVPSFGIAFYGSNATFEANEGNPTPAVDDNSISICSTVNRVFMIGNKSRGGIYIGQGCTTISVRDSRVVGWDGGPGIKLRGAIGCQFDRVVAEDPHTEQVYLFLDFADHCVFSNCWFEQHKNQPMTKHMIVLTDITRMCTFIAPFFTRPAGNGACLFLSADPSCRATLLMNPSAHMGSNSQGTSISATRSDLTIVGYAKIQQPSGFVDMTIG